ncbi:hypothetical protein Ato02nite_026470 [Paractinoplanes toevensis]|uniref:Uncharacterized protein n=1 Tax=Paractinoplanes toevensis TaxID=571911 RepID=A0A919TAV3_9ACTN|nr:hypothetical protein Ato02nite_026470 [Actinoplanes toevensis]
MWTARAATSAALVAPRLISRIEAPISSAPAATVRMLSDIVAADSATTVACRAPASELALLRLLVTALIVRGDPGPSGLAP